MPIPQAERRLILLSAGTAARRHSMYEQAARLLAEVDWSRLEETLRARKLLPVLGPRILELTGDSAGEGFVEAVERALEAGRRQAALLQLITLRIVVMLAEMGIRCAPLKGPLLAERIYGDVGRRLSSDLDLLVAPEQLREAVEVVCGLGYGAPTDYVQRDGLPLLHFALPHERGELPPVELHWRVHWYEQDFARERLLPPAVDSPGEWHPAPVDELVSLLLFYARDGFVDLRMATDLGAWWDTYRVELPSGALDEPLDSYPTLARVIPAAVGAAEKVVGLPGAQLLYGAHELGLRARTAVRLVNPNPRSSQSQLYAEMGLIDGLLAPSGGFGAFVRRQLLPPREVRDRQARHGAKRRTRSPLIRCVGVLGRYGLTMARLVRAPEALP